MCKIKKIVGLLALLAGFGVGEVWGMQEKNNPVMILRVNNRTLQVLLKKESNILVPISKSNIKEDWQLAKYTPNSKKISIPCYTSTLEIMGKGLVWVDVIQQTGDACYNHIAQKGELTVSKKYSNFNNTLTKLTYHDLEDIKRIPTPMTLMQTIRMWWSDRNNPSIWNSDIYGYRVSQKNYAITTTVPRMLHWAVPTFCSTLLGGLQEYLATKKCDPTLSYSTTLLPAAGMSIQSSRKSGRDGWKKWVPVVTSAAGYCLGKMATKWYMVSGKKIESEKTVTK